METDGTKSKSRYSKTLKRTRKRARARGAQSAKKRMLEKRWWNDPTRSVWGKNKKLEKFWQRLATGEYVVLIYKTGKHKHLKMPNPGTQTSTKTYNQFDADTDVVAVLSSSMSVDVYELRLYPKAKDSSVEHVIKHYKSFFKPLHAHARNSRARHTPIEDMPAMKKVMVP